MMLIYPGTKGAPVALQSVLRESHDALRVARARQIETRQKRRVPLDDSTDWQAVGEGVASVSLAHGERDSAAIAKAARELVEMTEGHALEPIGDYEPDAALDGIIVTMAVVADADRRMWSAETAAAWDRVRAARVAGDLIAAQNALNDLDTIASKVVGAVVVDISGAVDLEGKTVVEAMPALVLAGLLAPLYQAARYFLDLPAPKAVRCGLPPQST
jgi:hypothetical protein